MNYSEALEVADRIENDWPEAASLMRTMHEQIAPAVIHIDIARCTVRRRGVHMRFSPNQIAIIHHLYHRPGTYVPMSGIKVAVWGAVEARRRTNTNVLQVAISDVREKLMVLGLSIENKRTVGYRLQTNGAN